MGSPAGLLGGSLNFLLARPGVVGSKCFSLTEAPVVFVQGVVFFFGVVTSSGSTECLRGGIETFKVLFCFN